MTRGIFACLAGACLLAGGPIACRKAESKASIENAEEFKKPLPERFPQMRRIPIDHPKRAAIIATYERMAAEDPNRAQAIEDRNKLVWPPPPGFKPKAEGEKLELKIALKKTMLRRGEKLWFRLRVQNIGSESNYWSHAFFKTGGYTGGDSRWWRYVLTDPDGETELLYNAPAVDDFNPLEGYVEFPEGWTHEQKMAELRRRAAESRRKHDLHVSLYPGETIETSPWWWVPEEERELRKKEGLPEEPEFTGRFREFPFKHLDLTKTGTYRLRVEYGPELDLDPVEKTAQELDISFEELKRQVREKNARYAAEHIADTVEFEVVP